LDIYKILNQFEGKDTDNGELLVQYYTDHELYIRVENTNSKEAAAFIFEDSESDRKRARKLLEVLENYLSRTK
jgi:hypothetical protein